MVVVVFEWFCLHEGLANSKSVWLVVVGISGGVDGVGGVLVGWLRLRLGLGVWWIN